MKTMKSTAHTPVSVTDTPVRVALVSYGGVSGGLRAVEHLRQVFAELHATTVRDTVSFAAFREIDEVAFALPFTFDHEDYVQILTDIAAKPGPALGWGPGLARM